MVAGGYANADFVSHYISTPGFNPNIAVSDSGGYVVGPTLEIRLVQRLSFAVDALYKPLHYKQSATFYPDGGIGYAPATVVTWQFPLLAKYRFASGPAARYTRWAKDRYPWSHDVQTRSDQLEFLFRLTWGIAGK